MATPDLRQTNPLVTPDLQLSPSKARATQERERAWTQIDSWLSFLRHASPADWDFERNDETLKALQEMMHANENADELRRLIYQAKAEEVEGLKRRTILNGVGNDEVSGNADGRGLLAEVQGSLGKDGKQTLDDFASCAAFLGVSLTSTEVASVSHTLAMSIHDIMLSIIELKNRVATLNDIKAGVTTSMAETERTLTGIVVGKTEKDIESMQQQAAQWNRETKIISMKVSEYEERIAVLERALTGDSTVSDLRQQEARGKLLNDEIEKLRTNLEQFNGLPADIVASRQELRRAQMELNNLKQEREEIFATMREM